MTEKLENIPTNELVEELISREGVETNSIAPNAELLVRAEGPAIVLVIID